MIFPSLSQYVSVMLYPRGRFATLKNVRAVKDDNGEPIFCSFRHSMLFLADVDGVRCSLRFFTNEGSGKNCGNILHNEIVMDGGTFDVVVEEPFIVNDCKADILMKDDMCEGRAIIELDGKYGFANENGELVVEPKYGEVANFSEGRAVVVIDQLYGLIDVDGNEIIAPIWDDLSYDGSTLCYVERDGLCGVIDRTGKTITEPIWDWTGEYSQGMLLVEKDEKYGFLDMEGRIAIDIKYDDATSFGSHKYATVTLCERQYQIDTQENRV